MSSTTTHENQVTDWDAVRADIVARWPNISASELRDCREHPNDLANFLNNRVDAEEDDIREIVHELIQSASNAGAESDASGASVPQSSSSEDRGLQWERCIAEHPTQSLLSSFAFGITLGSLVTALWFRSRPEPSTWEKIRNRDWH